MIKYFQQFSAITPVRMFTAFITTLGVFFAFQAVLADPAPNSSTIRTSSATVSPPFTDGTYTILPEYIHTADDYTHSETDVITGSTITGTHRFQSNHAPISGSWSWQGTIKRSLSGNFVITGQGVRKDNTIAGVTHFTLDGQIYWGLQSGVVVLIIDSNGHADPGFPYRTGGITSKPTPLPINIVSSRMISDHVLEIKTRRDFLDSAIDVQVNTTINGKEITTVPQLLKTSVDINGKTNDTSPIHIDLAAQGVPRFKKNQKFTLVTSVLYNDMKLATDTKNAVVFLPVVIVPGIDPFGGASSSGGDGTFTGLENSLESQSHLALDANDILGDRYSLRNEGPVLAYPTLYTVSYNRNNATFAQGADAISSLIVSTIKQKTYADAINLVGHSKGCLVARKYLVTAPQPASVSRCIMCQGPHLGSLLARLDNLFGYDYTNLYPLWPWLKNVSVRYPNSPFVLPPPFNTELSSLNGQPLPPEPYYEIIYSNKGVYALAPTPYTKTVTNRGTTVTSIDGDLVVPVFSQRAIIQNPNNPNAPVTRIYAFKNIPADHFSEQEIDGTHIGDYMDSDTVDSEIFSQITSDL